MNVCHLKTFFNVSLTFKQRVYSNPPKFIFDPKGGFSSLLSPKEKLLSKGSYTFSHEFDLYFGLNLTSAVALPWVLHGTTDNIN